MQDEFNIPRLLSDLTLANNLKSDPLLVRSINGINHLLDSSDAHYQKIQELEVELKKAKLQENRTNVAGGVMLFSAIGIICILGLALTIAVVIIYKLL